MRHDAADMALSYCKLYLKTGSRFKLFMSFLYYEYFLLKYSVPIAM